MRETYVRKQEVVDVECITVELFDRLHAQDPGFVKHASIGDYLVSRGLGTPARIVTPGQLAEEYEKQDGSTRPEVAPLDRLVALERAFEKYQGEVLALLKTRQSFGEENARANQPKPYAIAPEATKPETPRAKGKQ